MWGKDIHSGKHNLNPKGNEQDSASHMRKTATTNERTIHDKARPNWALEGVGRPPTHIDRPTPVSAGPVPRSRSGLHRV